MSLNRVSAAVSAVALAAAPACAPKDITQEVIDNISFIADSAKTNCMVAIRACEPGDFDEKDSNRTVQCEVAGENSRCIITASKDGDVTYNRIDFLSGGTQAFVAAYLDADRNVSEIMSGTALDDYVTRLYSKISDGSSDTLDCTMSSTDSEKPKTGRVSASAMRGFVTTFARESVGKTIYAFDERRRSAAAQATPPLSPPSVPNQGLETVLDAAMPSPDTSAEPPIIGPGGGIVH
ncbi:MAG: hypothetical protein AAB592_05375 [Patescibacteria group bacterium]